MKVFYDHLVLREELTVELEAYEMTDQDREHILDLIDQALHHHVLDVIFTHLPKHKHPEFVQMLHQAPHEESLLAYLKREIATDIEKLIQDQARKIKAEILEEIKRSQRLAKTD